jgi:hypothetical protein
LFFLVKVRGRVGGLTRRGDVVVLGWVMMVVSERIPTGGGKKQNLKKSQ